MAPESSDTVQPERTLARPPARLFQAIQEPVGSVISCLQCAKSFRKPRKKSVYCSPKCYFKAWNAAHPRRAIHQVSVVENDARDGAQSACPGDSARAGFSGPSTRAPRVSYPLG
jgi:hypothetical protein